MAYQVRELADRGSPRSTIGRTPPSAAIRAHQSLDVLGEHVDLDIDPVPGPQPAQVRALQCLRYQRHREAVLAKLGDRQADAVEGHRALFDQIAREVAAGPRLDLEVEHAREPLLAYVCDGRGPVDVPLHDVTAQARVGPQSKLDVHAGAGLQRTKRRASERLVHRLCAETVRMQLGRGEANTVDGHR